jgi:hypothetical protein
MRCSFSVLDLDAFPNKIHNQEKTWRIEGEVEVLLGAKEGILCFRVMSQGKKIGSTTIAFANYAKEASPPPYS